MLTMMIDTPVNDISQKRRVIYHSLFPYFSNEALMKVMWIWQENYSNNEDASMRQFINEITHNTNNKPIAKKIYNAIVANSINNNYALNEDPIDKMLAYREGKLRFKDEPVSSVVMNIPINIVFNFILENLNLIISKESKYHATKTREYFSINLFKLGLDTKRTKEILHWTQDPTIFIGLKYSTEEFSSLLHIFYIGMCEYFGPQKADIFLNSAIELADQLPEAKEISPKSFL